MKLQALSFFIALMILPVMTSLRIPDISTNYSTVESIDSYTKTLMQTEVQTFVDESRRSGKITKDAYNDLVSAINEIGYSFEVGIEIKELGESNASNSNAMVIGENFYYTVESSDIIEKIQSDGVYKMKEGDILSCYINNGSNVLNTVAQHSGLVVATGE